MTRRTICLGLALALVAGEGGAALGTTSGPRAIAMADQLLAVKHERTCEITTRGRRTGNPHTVTVWFAVDGDVLYLSTLDGTRDWVRNALTNPTVTIRFGNLSVAGRVQDVTKTEFDERVRDALKRKYWLAWIGGWFGQGPERTFKVDRLRLAF